MGTRGLIGLRYKNQDKFTYNHFDSYPQELGVNTLQQIKKFKIEQMKKSFNKLNLIDEDKKPTKKDIQKYSKFLDLSVGNKDYDWYNLLRIAQGRIEVYLSGEVTDMINSNDFIKDSLFCEWAYIINLDTEKLEVWKGFQETPQENRYKITQKSNNGENGYFNCALIKEYDLNKLPNKTKFLKDLKEEDEE